MSRIRMLVGLIILGVSLPARAQIPGLVPEKSWDLDGYIKYMASASYPEQGSDSLDHLIHQRFNYEYRFSSELHFNAGMRNRLIWGDAAKSPAYSKQISQDSGYMDLSKNWKESGDMVGNSQLDRLYFSWNDGYWLASGGRFRINWSMTTVWNPNDVFNVYSIYDFDYEERSGADAIMVSRKLGFASAMDLVYNPASESEQDSYAARYLFNHNGWDIQLIGGKSQLDIIAGVGFAGGIKGAGVRGELSYFEPTRSRWGGEELDNSTVSSIEADYSFPGGRNWVVRGALLHISHPVDTYSAATFLNQSLSTRNLSFTEFSGFAEVGFDISSLNRLSISGIYYQDKSVYFTLTNQYSLADDWQLAGVIQRFDGDDSSLFGMIPATLVYAQIRWNF